MTIRTMLLHALAGRFEELLAHPDKAKVLSAKGKLLEATDDPPRYMIAARIGAVAPGILPGDKIVRAFVVALNLAMRSAPAPT